MNKLLAELKTLKIKNFIVLSIAGLINSVGVNLILEPLNFLDGGFSGLSEYLGMICSPYITISIFLLIFNIPIFVFGAKKEGINFIIYSLYGIAMYSLWAFLFKSVFSIPLTKEGVGYSPITQDDKFVSAVFGGLLSGIGSGLVIRYGGALDGTDVLAILTSRKFNVSLGSLEFVFNIIMYSIVAFIEHSWILPLYSLVAYGVCVKAVDFIVLGIDKGKSATIVTSHGRQVASELSKSFGRGITILEAQGYYSSSTKTMIYCVINRFEIFKLKTLVKSIDQDAFITITDISDAVSMKGKKGGNFPFFGKSFIHNEEEEKFLPLVVLPLCEQEKAENEEKIRCQKNNADKIFPLI
jgi:uncharacterized membrane-anchored protein YitT (DUF2179 family)